MSVLGMNDRDILEWFASTVHKKHELMAQTPNWYACKYTPCSRLSKALVERRIPPEHFSTDGAGTY